MMAAWKIRIALGADEMTAVLPDRVLVVPLESTLRPRLEDPGPALQQGLGRLEAALRSEYGDDRLAGQVRLQVALVPPLSEARLVDLPPLRPTEVDKVLQRVAPRHFPGDPQDLVVGGERLGKGTTVKAAPLFAAAASRKLVESLHQAITSRGWRIERIVPAQACWVQALREAIPHPVRDRSSGDRGLPRLVVAVVADVVYLVRMAGSRPDRLRRIADHDLSEVVAAAGPETGRALVLAEGGMRTPLAHALEEAGWILISPGEDRGAGVEAARQAVDARPELVSPSLVFARRRRERNRTRTMAAMAVFLLVAAAAVHLWSVDRTLVRVQAERATLRHMFAPALAMHDSLGRMVERVESLQALEEETTRWTAFLVELSVLLPRDAHLVSLRGEGTRVVVEAVGDRAGEALTALRQASTFRDVRLEGLIRRDLEEGMTSREHFTLSMVLASGGDR